MTKRSMSLITMAVQKNKSYKHCTSFTKSVQREKGWSRGKGHYRFNSYDLSIASMISLYSMLEGVAESIGRPKLLLALKLRNPSWKLLCNGWIQGNSSVRRNVSKWRSMFLSDQDSANTTFIESFRMCLAGLSSTTMVLFAKRNHRRLNWRYE